MNLPFFTCEQGQYPADRKRCSILVIGLNRCVSYLIVYYIITFNDLNKDESNYLITLTNEALQLSPDCNHNAGIPKQW